MSLREVKDDSQEESILTEGIENLNTGERVEQVFEEVSFGLVVHHKTKSQF